MRERKQLAANLVRLRLKAGLTQEQLCERADIDRSYLQRIESARSNPTFEVLLRLKKALGCAWEDLMRGIAN